MKEKKLKLLTTDDLCLSQGVITGVEENGTRKTIIVQTAFFGEISTTTYGDRCVVGVPYSSIDVKYYAEKDFRIIKTVNVFGKEVELNVLSTLDLRNYTTIKEVKESYPELAELLLSRMNPLVIETINDAKTLERKINKERIQTKFNNIKTIYEEIGNKADIATITDINELYYCEAETFLDKIIDRINKKANPKNLRMYKRLAELNNESVIECED